MSMKINRRKCEKRLVHLAESANITTCKRSSTPSASTSKTIPMETASMRPLSSPSPFGLTKHHSNTSRKSGTVNPGGTATKQSPKGRRKSKLNLSQKCLKQKLLLELGQLSKFRATGTTTASSGTFPAIIRWKPPII